MMAGMVSGQLLSRLLMSWQARWDGIGGVWLGEVGGASAASSHMRMVVGNVGGAGERWMLMRSFDKAS